MGLEVLYLGGEGLDVGKGLVKLSLSLFKLLVLLLDRHILEVHLGHKLYILQTYKEGRADDATYDLL